MMHEMPAPGRPRRPRRRRLATAVAALAAAALLAACGSQAAPGTAGSPAGSAPAAPVKPKVSLTITVVNGPDKPITRWTLRCDPAGGTHPDPAAACAALAAIKQPFAVTKVGVVCPMILASARRATFTGTYFGAPVNRTIIDGGCDLAHWSQLGQVVN
jgi:hypothetical protein